MSIRVLIVLVSLCFTLQVSAEMLPAKSLSLTNKPIMVSNKTTRSDQIVLKYQIPEPTYLTTPIQKLDNKRTIRAHISNCPYYKEAGKPEVPRIPVRAILPYGKSVDRIEVVSDGEIVSVLKSPLSWGEMDQPISERARVTTSPDSRIYNSDEIFPQRFYSSPEIQKALGISILKVDLYPLKYQAKSKTVKFYKDISLVVYLKSEAPTNDIRIDVKRFKERGKLSEENERALDTYTVEAIRQDACDYVLITSEEIASNTTVSPNVSDLIKLREEQGLVCKVVTIDEIENGYSGASTSVKIRNFIKHAYNNWNTKFVTLGGDVDVVDYQTVKIWYGWDRFIPSDMPYQCLDGDTWSGDYEAEVYVGRMSAENAEEFSNQLHKIIEYETEPSSSSYIRTSLGVGSNLDTQNWGMDAIEYLYQNIYPASWQHDSLYEKVADWGQQDMIDALASHKYGNLDHDGHATENGTISIGVGETDRLTNTKYPFLYTLSCLAGKFTVDCIAEQLISEHKVGGFFGGILNSDVGLYSANNSIDGSSPKMQRAFWTAFWEKDMKYFSEFNAYSHQMTNGEMGERFSCATTNYFGDAATRFRGKDDLSVSIIENSKIMSKNHKINIAGVAVHGKRILFNLNIDSELIVKIYSLNGKTVYSIPQKRYLTGSNSIELKKNGLSKGIYIVEFKTGLSKVSQKIKM